MKRLLLVFLVGVSTVWFAFSSERDATLSKIKAASAMTDVKLKKALETYAKKTELEKEIAAAPEATKGLKRTQLGMYLIGQDYLLDGESAAVAAKPEKQARIDVLRTQFKAATSASVKTQLYGKIVGVINEK
jgi:hypothetical protein